jgi:[ribosomal protein S5]-alanine N-acetyltransferase
MSKVKIRYQKVSDAKRFYEILKNPNFAFLRTKVKSVADEIRFLRQNAKKRKDNIEYNFTILYNDFIVGGCGIKINQHRKFIGEIGYFIDEKYWGNGIASKAVRELEKIGFGKLKLKRIEIIMETKHKASEKVAIKCKYKKEGITRKAIENSGEYFDAYLYAKTKK